MALPGSSAFFKAPTALEQLLEEINFQRTKEMRQLMKDDSGFVVLQGTSYWTDLFVRHFLFQTEHCIDCDDLLFFVRKKHIKSSSRYLPKFETEVDVFRKASRKLPIGDPDMDWEETVYLNLIIHQFDYTLTLAICTRTSPKELQVLKRHSQKVYASPSRRRMDTKAEAEEMTYPNVCFMVDNFNEVFCDILVRDGEMVCVELVASDRDGAVQGVIFLGSIRYDALKRVYDARSSLSSKMAQRMTFGLFSNSSSQRVEFVRMKGPQGKGHAEMAVTKPKGYGAETPTSEPGYCATDMWDSDWDSDPEDFFVYRHQRRLSDPSANINNFVRGGWKTKPADTAGAKSRSENEGLDSLANGLNEIEAGDLRDDCEFCKHSASTVCKPSVSNHEVSPSTESPPTSSPPASSPPASSPPASSPPASSSPVSSLIASFFPVNKTRATHLTPKPDQTVSSAAPPPSCSDENAKEPSAADPPSSPNHETSSCSDVSTPTTHEPPRDPLLEKPPPSEAPGGAAVTNAASNAASSAAVGPSKETSDDEDDDSDFEDCLSSLSEATPVAKSSSASPENSPIRQEVWKDASDVCPHNKVDNCAECTSEKSVTTNENSNSESQVAESANGTYRTAQRDDFVEKKRNGENVELPERVFKTDVSQNVLSERGDIGGTWPRKRAPGVTTAALTKDEATKCKHGVKGNCILCGDRRPFFEKLRERHKEQVALMEKENDLSSGRTERGPRPHCSRCNNERNSHRSHSIPLAPLPEPELAAEAELEVDAELEPMSPRRLSRTLSRRRQPDSSSRRDPPKVHSQSQPPHRLMPDGTSIYYWCDVAEKPRDQAEHELDDGAYNPLWTMRGFTQTFHFWKENKRAQSVPLNAFLTYITLPWWSIAKDILDHREKPTLTF